MLDAGLGFLLSPLVQERQESFTSMNRQDHQVTVTRLHESTSAATLALIAPAQKGFRGQGVIVTREPLLVHCYLLLYFLSSLELSGSDS